MCVMVEALSLIADRWEDSFEWKISIVLWGLHDEVLVYYFCGDIETAVKYIILRSIEIADFNQL